MKRSWNEDLRFYPVYVTAGVILAAVVGWVSSPQIGHALGRNKLTSKWTWMRSAFEIINFPSQADFDDLLTAIAWKCQICIRSFPRWGCWWDLPFHQTWVSMCFHMFPFGGIRVSWDFQSNFIVILSHPGRSTLSAQEGPVILRAPERQVRRMVSQLWAGDIGVFFFIFDDLWLIWVCLKIG